MTQASSDRKRKALLVHIHQETMALMRGVLEAKDLDVIETGNPVDGLSLIERHRPDIVIHNAQMPFMDGEAFDRRIRKKYGPERPAIIWMSLLPLKTKHVAGCGIRAWIKPCFEPAEFSYFIEEALK